MHKIALRTTDAHCARSALAVSNAKAHCLSPSRLLTIILLNLLLLPGGAEVRLQAPLVPLGSVGTLRRYLAQDLLEVIRRLPRFRLQALERPEALPCEQSKEFLLQLLLTHPLFPLGPLSATVESIARSHQPSATFSRSMPIIE